MNKKIGLDIDDELHNRLLQNFTDFIENNLVKSRKLPKEIFIASDFIQFADPETRAILFANMMKTLKKGGLLLLQGYTPKQLDYKTGGPPLLSHLYTEDLLRDTFKEMEILDLKLYEDLLQEGTQHAGQSALIGLVARKL